MNGRRRVRWVALRMAGAVAAVATIGACGAPQAMVLGQMCVPANNGAAVVVEGFVQVGEEVDCDSSTGEYRCSIDISEQPDDPFGNMAGLDMLAGGGADQMEEPPSTFTKHGLLIRADDGRKVAVGERVRASGSLTVEPGSCFVEVDKLEKI
jgi:hypothetical protein